MPAEYAKESGAAGAEEMVFELENVTKRFRAGQRRVTALEGVSVRMKRGLIGGLIGPDGAGKTTLMRLAAGLLSPDEGTIRVLGLDATRDSLSVQASIGYMPQRFGLYEDLTVQENLDLYASLQGVSEEDRPLRYGELMRMTGLAPFTSRLAGALSGGMKQKLGLACTLVRPPRLLLLDEPTVGVDPVSRRELWAIVRRLVKEEGMSVLLSTAYLDEAERCHEVIMLHEGRLLGQAPPGEFSSKLQGCSYSVTTPGMKKRAVQERLAESPGVVDAVIQGDSIRLVMETADRPDIGKLLPDVEQVLLNPVPPRFEDSFIAMLKTRKPGSVRLRASGPGSGGKVHSRDSGESVIEVRNVERRFGSFMR